jgi:hypothetical protein
MPLKTEEPAVTRKLPIRKIISGLMFASIVVVIVLGLRKPDPVAVPLGADRKAVNAQSFQQKIDQLSQAQAQGQSGAEVHLTAEEIRAAFTVASEAPQPSPQQSATPADAVQSQAALDAVAGAGQPNVSEPQVTFEGDIMKGQFATELGGKKVYVTVNGRLGSKDGYATFEPTEFKVGDLNVPVSLVNDALQKKMLEQRDKLKLPDYISDVKVENGELVVKQK